LPADRIAALKKAVDDAEKSHLSRSALTKLNSMASSVEESSSTAKSPADTTRLHALAEILKHPQA
jgi:hypothetical protein